MTHLPELKGPERRARAQSRLRGLSRGVVLAATGATAVIAVVVAREHPGSSSSGSSSTASGATSTPTNGTTSTTSGSSTPSSDEGSSEYHHHGAIIHLVHANGDVRRYLTMTVTAASDAGLTARWFRAIGTTVSVVVQQPDQANLAESMLARALEEIDLACSRFREDSELAMLHAEAGRTVRVSGLLFEALEVACMVAARTSGAVDPTVGNAICALGYDADLAEVQARGPLAVPLALGVVPGYSHVQLDPRTRSVRIPRGVRLDLGSSAKALAADRAAARIAHAVNGGVLVSLGGDVAVAGPSPRDGWAVGIAHESSVPAEEVDQVVAIRHGGLASSAVGARTWRSTEREMHHIVDPRTGDCAEPHWSLVSATGASCVEANLVTTASLVWGADALDQLRRFDQSVRLVRFDGRVFTVNGWPHEETA